LCPTFLVVVVALLHVYFLFLEMFLWDQPAGLRALVTHAGGRRPRRACWPRIKVCKTGSWPRAALGRQPRHRGPRRDHVFLGCVLVAGIFGAATASRKILYVQAMPALIALAALRLF
jgi:putative membrane protein